MKQADGSDFSSDDTVCIHGLMNNSPPLNLLRDSFTFFKGEGLV